MSTEADHKETPPEKKSRAWIAVMLSVLMHGALVAWAVWVPPVRDSSFKIEFEFAESSQLTGLGQEAEPLDEDLPPLGPEIPPEGLPESPPPEPDPPPPKPKPRPKPKPKPKLAKKPEPKKTKPKAKPKPVPAGPRASYKGAVAFKPRSIPGVSSVAPGNAMFTAMIDNRELRRSPHRKVLEELVRSLPDYHRVVGQTGYDPVSTYDQLMIASADIRYLHENLLVGSTSLSEEKLRERLGEVAGEPLTWKREGGLPVARPEKVWWAKKGDERAFFLPGDGLVAFGRTEYASFLKAGKKKGFFAEMPQAIDPKTGALPAVLVIEVSKLRMALPGHAATLPPPNAVKLALHDDKSPLLRASLGFAKPEDAARFAKRWPGVKKKLLSDVFLTLLGYARVLEKVQLKEDGGSVYLELRLTPKETTRFVKLAARSIEARTRHLQPKPGDLPPLPGAQQENAEGKKEEDPATHKTPASKAPADAKEGAARRAPKAPVEGRKRPAILFKLEEGGSKAPRGGGRPREKGVE